MWFKKKGSVRVKEHVERFVETFHVARLIDAKLDGLDQPKPYTEFGFMLHYAAVYGAADSFAQMHNISEEDTVRGIELYLAKYSNGAEVLRKILVAGTIPELSDIVRASGQAVQAAAMLNGDVTAAFSALYADFKRRERG